MSPVIRVMIHWEVPWRDCHGLFVFLCLRPRCKLVRSRSWEFMATDVTGQIRYVTVLVAVKRAARRVLRERKKDERLWNG